MSEITPAGGGGSSRQVFIILAIGLAGLLILGLIGLGGVFIFNQMARPAATNTPTRGVPTATRTVAIAIAPTATVEPPTATPVVPTAVVPTATPVTSTPTGGSGTITATVPAGTGTPSGTLPESGLGEDLLLLAGGIVLVLVIFTVRRARASAA